MGSTVYRTDSYSSQYVKKEGNHVIINQPGTNIVYQAVLLKPPNYKELAFLTLFCNPPFGNVLQLKTLFLLDSSIQVGLISCKHWVLPHDPMPFVFFVLICEA